MMVNTFFENKVDQLFEGAGRLAEALTRAGIEYRVVGGFAAYMHVNEVEPRAARLTRDIDVAVDRNDLDAIIEAVRLFGFPVSACRWGRHTRGRQCSQGPQRRAPVVRARLFPSRAVR